MPEKYIKAHDPYAKVYTLAAAAAHNQILVVHCNHCQRTVHYLAADLVPIIGGDGYARDAPFPCSVCKKKDYVQVKLRSPAPGDYGSLIVRRPADVVVTQRWKW